MHYSVQIFVKGYGSLSFAKNMDKILVKISAKTWEVNIAGNLLIILNNLQQMHLKLPQKELFKKTAKATGDLTGNKVADKISKV